jgi:hypothetical protein
MISASVRRPAWRSEETAAGQHVQEGNERNQPNLLHGEAGHQHRPKTGQERRSIRRDAVGILADETESDSSGGNRAVDVTHDFRSEP